MVPFLDLRLFFFPSPPPSLRLSSVAQDLIPRGRGPGRPVSDLAMHPFFLSWMVKRQGPFFFFPPPFFFTLIHSTTPLVLIGPFWPLSLSVRNTSPPSSSPPPFVEKASRVEVFITIAVELRFCVRQKARHPSPFRLLGDRCRGVSPFPFSTPSSPIEGKRRRAADQ